MMKHKVLSITGSTRGTAYTMSNKILTHAGKTHVAWLDQICKIYVRTYHHRTRRWAKPVYVGTGDDNHAGAAFAMDSRGYLHLAFGPHHNPIRHVVSKRPNTSTSWVEQPSFGGTTATYPSLVCDADDTLHACYRGSYAAERPWSLVYQKKKKGGAWTDPVKLVDPEGPPAYTQFENALHIDRRGTLYLAYHIVRATEADYGDTRGRGFGLMRSRDRGESWQTVDGRALDLPTTPASPCIIEFEEGLDVRMGNVVCGSRGAPCFTLNRREGGVAETFFYAWRKHDWQVVSLMPVAERLYGPCEMSDVCALSIADDGVIYAAVPVCRRGGGWSDSSNEIALFTSRDGGETFSGYRISADEPDASNWLPALERQTGHNRVDVPRLVYTHGHIGEGCSPDIDTEIRYVSLNGIAEAEAAVADARVAGAEQLSGIRFTEVQRGKMRRDVEQYRLRYRELREVDVGYDVSPASVFLPGVNPPPPGEQRPFRLTAARIERPESGNDLAFLPVSALARLVENRDVSPVELTRLYIDRLRVLRRKAPLRGFAHRRIGDDAGQGRRGGDYGRELPRSSSRDPVGRQGSAVHKGDPDHVGRHAIQGTDRRDRRGRCGAASGRGRGSGGQAVNRRARQRAALVRGDDPEPLGYGDRLERVFGRSRRRDRRRPGRIQHRFGNAWLHRFAQRYLRGDGSAANLRPREPLRRDGACLDHGQTGSDVPWR